MCPVFGRSILSTQCQLPRVILGQTLKARITERRIDGMAKSQNGGKSPQNLKDGIMESRNGGKYPQIVKDGMTENHPKS